MLLSIVGIHSFAIALAIQELFAFIPIFYFVFATTNFMQLSQFETAI